MDSVLSIIFLALYVILTIYFLSGNSNNARILNNNRYSGFSYEMSPLMKFTIFTIISGPLFLIPPYRLIKYGIYFIVLLGLWFSGKIVSPKSWIVNSYWIFIFWLFICAFRGSSMGESIMFLIKYILPILSLYLGYSAFRSNNDIYPLIKWVLVGVFIYTFLIGGLTAKLYKWVYFLLWNQFHVYAGFANYITSLFVMPFIMVWITGKRKWYWVAIAMILSTILESVRTGLGGISIVVSIYYLYRYKFKSIPIIGGIGILMIAIIFFNPAMNERFFGDRAGRVGVEDIVNKEGLSLENIDTHGRSEMWAEVMSQCFDGNELTGSGLGSAITTLNEINAEGMKFAGLLHNDYVQIMCDTGEIGIGLLIIFFIILVFSITSQIWNTNNFYVKITGIMALASSSGIAFSMGFDNVVSHSMDSLIMPFIFLGIYLKALELSKSRRLYYC